MNIFVSLRAKLQTLFICKNFTSGNHFLFNGIILTVYFFVGF